VAFVSEHPTQWKRNLALPRMVSLLIEMVSEETSPDTALQLALSMVPQHVSIMNVSQKAPGTKATELAGKNLHILYTSLLSSASAMFFFPLSNYFLHLSSTLSLQSNSTWIIPWDCHKILVKPVGQTILQKRKLRKDNLFSF
jgi:hypothetical protein